MLGEALIQIDLLEGFSGRARFTYKLLNLGWEFLSTQG